MQIFDGGLSGWGEAMPLPGWPGADLSATRRALEAWAAGPESSILPGERFAHGAVELALLDLEAQRAGRRQSEVLAAGRPVSGSVELNALVSDAHGAAAAVVDGYRTVKLKVGASDLDEEMAAVAAVRGAIGTAARLRLDANGAWTMAQAVTVLTQLEQYDIEYVEEPVVGIEALAKIAEQSPVPVAVDDSLSAAQDQVPEAIAVVVVKPMALGGPRTAYAAARRWTDQGRKVVVTNYLDSAIGQHAALSVAAALPGPPQVHGAVTPGLFTRDIAETPPVAEGCCLLSPQSPIAVDLNLSEQ
ncbi:mandelate racemase/muconate lactonizing enzyme family protein [Candidatus Poriferisocius sp.]|uniref:mandelate racemase/muconate lactonizing enzyme family protein n=1 Tax=Candidatus Poriferisocius sp. TaxID=3101276 RepID=UPI003B010CEA